MGTLYLKQNDTEPDHVMVLKDPGGAVHVLNGDETVKLLVTLRGTSTSLAFALQISNAAAGEVKWVKTSAIWAPGMLVPGVHKVEVEVVTVGGADRLTFPNRGYDTLAIDPDLADG